MYGMYVWSFSFISSKKNNLIGALQLPEILSAKSWWSLFILLLEQPSINSDKSFKEQLVNW